MGRGGYKAIRYSYLVSNFSHLYHFTLHIHKGWEGGERGGRGG